MTDTAGWTTEDLTSHLAGRFTIVVGPRGSTSAANVEYQSVKGGPCETEAECLSDWLARFDVLFAGMSGELNWQEPPKFQQMPVDKAFDQRPAGWYSYCRCVVVPT